MPTINISLRVVQRSVEEFTDILAKNPGLWINVVDRKNNPVFVAKLPGTSDVLPYSVSDRPFGTPTAFNDNLPYVTGDKCDKCKKQAECKKLTEEGMGYKICMICALKAKLNWHKLEKL